MTASIASSLVPPLLKVSKNDSGIISSRQRWTAWKTRLESYALITKLEEEDPKFRFAVLIQCFSAETITLVESLPFEDESHRMQVDKVLELLENHFVGEVNEIFESFNFFTRQQRVSETNTAYIAEVRRLEATCDFGDLQERMSRDKIVCGIRDNALHKSLLEDRKLTLKKCVDRCKAVESFGRQAQNITKGRQDMTEDQSVSLNHERARATQRCNPHNAQPPQATFEAARDQFRDRSLPAGGPRGGARPVYGSRCKRCGSTHGQRSCPAFGRQCRRCGGWNHFCCWVFKC